MLDWWWGIGLVGKALIVLCLVTAYAEFETWWKGKHGGKWRDPRDG